MSTYYKYAEQSADSQVNWAQVGKSVSDMLNEEVKIREQKKAAIDDAFQKDMQNLSSAPQGKWQDGNKFTNDYAHGLTQMQLNDYKLLKSGQMSVQDYTLRRQNYINGTNTLFDLQKSYQSVYDDRMQGILSGKYQAMTGAEMAQVEGFKDFSNSRAVIDPYTGIVNVGKLVKNPTTGVMELSKDVVPVNVLKGKINTPIPAWEADKAINGIVEKFGENVEFLYNAAGTTRAGTITKLLGLGALEGEYAKKGKDGKPLYPQFRDSIDKINKGINDSISSAFSNPYNISSVLTQNLGGKYNQDSYTFDKDVAANDKGKILLKIDATTGLSTLDKDSPNYKAQEQEARDWVKGQMLSKMDAKREMTTTGYAPAPQRESEGEREARIGKRTAVTDAQSVGALWGGDEVAIQEAITRFRDMNDKILGVTRDTNGVSVRYIGPDGGKYSRTIPFKTSGGLPLTQEQFIRAAGPLLTGNKNINDAISKGGYLKDAKFNPTSTASATVEQEGERPTGLPPTPMTNKYLPMNNSSSAGNINTSVYNAQ